LKAIVPINPPRWNHALVKRPSALLMPDIWCESSNGMMLPPCIRSRLATAGEILNTSVP
jgi:hypothetical protein